MASINSSAAVPQKAKAEPKASGTTELDRLIAESEAAIKRLDAIQHKRHNATLWERVTRHFSKNSPHLINVLLAGSVFAVALGRLSQKHEHQAEKEQWEQQQQRLQREKEAADARAAAVLHSTEALVQGLEEAAGKGRRDLPQYVLQQLAEWRQQAATAQQQLEGTPASLALGSGASSSSSKIMI